MTRPAGRQTGDATMATATLDRANEVFANAAGVETIGEIVTWDVDPTKVRYSDILDALDNAELERSLAKPVRPYDAFKRAVKTLAGTDTIVRKVDECNDTIRFQVTREGREDDGLTYARDCHVVFHKISADLECVDHATLDKVREEMERCIENRTGADISRIVHRVFEDKRNAEIDLIPLRETGGVYFVRSEGNPFTDKVQTFMLGLLGRLNRFPIAKSYDNKSVRDAVAEKMATLIQEYRDAIEAFGTDTRESTIEKSAQRVKLLKYKIESYADYLEGEKDHLLSELDFARERFSERIAEIARERSEGLL